LTVPLGMSFYFRVLDDLFALEFDHYSKKSIHRNFIYQSVNLLQELDSKQQEKSYFAFLGILSTNLQPPRIFI
jgi:hypothetical protein